MRYRFRGLKRDTGKAVEGHVEAPTEDTAYEVLSDHGIVTESLRPDPRPRPAVPTTTSPGDGTPQAASASASASASGSASEDGSGDGGEAAKQAWDIADAIESAFDTSAQQVAVDKLAARFRGQRVWVIDRDKIRRRVMQLVEQAVKQANAKQETPEQMRDRIDQAMKEMFQDNRNLTSQAQPGQEAGQGAAQGQAPAAQQAGAPNEALENQINRLSRVVEGMERAVANLTQTLRSGVAMGGGPARFTHEPRERTEEQSAALLEVFESNLELRRELEGGNADAETSTAQS